MILKTERKKLKRLLKNRYIDDILAILEHKSVTNAAGEPFSRAFISQVFNGNEAQKDIEEAIFELYERRKLEVSKMKAKRKEILKP